MWRFATALVGLDICAVFHVDALRPSIPCPKHTFRQQHSVVTGKMGASSFDYQRRVAPASWHNMTDLLSNDFPVDIVIAASLATDADVSSAVTRVTRDRDNGELKYTLRSIAQHAPWVHKIFLLMNGSPHMPEWVPEPEKTTIVNRCSLLPVDPSLPQDQCTRNGFVVQAIIHKTPGLSEHFLYTDDDNMLGKDAYVNDFFHGQVPYFGNSRDAGQGENIYSHPRNTGLRDDQIPKTIAGGHTWNALTIQSCQEMENRFPEWFSFVRSHRTGRYSSKLNQSGTTESEHANSLEEAFSGGTWWWWLKTKHEGEYSGSAKFDDGWLGNYDESAWNARQHNPPFILNVNDDMSVDSATKYKMQHELMTKVLDIMFPDPQAASGNTSRSVINWH